MHNVAVLIGSLRQNSHNLALALALEKLAGSRLSFNFTEIGDLPHYNDDMWPAPPQAVSRLKAEIEAADAILFVTPEFNRSIPAVLKNAIDWASRPWGQNSWSGKVASIVGTSPGSIGSAVAQSHLRSMLPNMGVLLMGEPEVYFQTQADSFSPDHDVLDDGARALLSGYVDRFVTFIDRHSERPLRKASAA